MYLIKKYKFFENKQCEFYPCHKGLKEINCLFCYCVLFNSPFCKNSNDCINCTFPHQRKNYDKIIRILKNMPT